MELATTESHQVLSHLLDHASDPLFLLDANGKFLWVNQRTEQLFGRTRADLQAQTLWDCWPHLAGTEFNTQLRRSLQHQHSVHFRFRLGSISNRPMEAGIYPTPQGLLVTLRETSQSAGLGAAPTAELSEPRVQHPPSPSPQPLELGLLPDKTADAPRPSVMDVEARVAERTAQLQETITSLESLCYNIAHDLRAPLRAMQGMSSALLEEYGSTLDETAKEYAERIVTSANRMDRLIQDLLAYGRLSRSDLECGNTDLETPLASVLARLEPEISPRNARIEVQRPLPMVWANPTLLEHIFTNLLSNALRFTQAGIAPQIRIWAEETNATVRLWVGDNGIGVDPAHHQKIFQIFERLDPGSTFPGTGMGLAIVKKAAERMGGYAGVESTPGNGSRFWVELQPSRPEEPA
jgi:PAS domain S-box-containing protein